jgi:hypothetical protein
MIPLAFDFSFAFPSHEQQASRAATFEPLSPIGTRAWLLHNQSIPE